MMERIGKVPIEDVLPHVGDDAPRRAYFGQAVGMSSKRLLCFAVHGVKCVECGLKGKFFAVERHQHQHAKSYHINLYALDGEGKEVLMTKDHVKPKALGGTDNLKNLRTLCTKCNFDKGSGWFVYLIRCSSDNSLYCGMTNNIKNRLKKHGAGHGSKYVRSRRPIRLVYSEMLPDKSSALRREAEIKSWDKDAKEALVAKGASNDGRAERQARKVQHQDIQQAPAQPGTTPCRQEIS
jgi:putative endonuclease